MERLRLRRVESVILPVGGSSGSVVLSNQLLSLPLLVSEYSAALRLQTIIPKDCDPGAGRI